MPKLHKDGLARNLEKMKNELYILDENLADEFERLAEERDSHSYVEIFVEACRESPYFMGHVDAFVWPGFIISVILNLWFIFS